MTGVDGDVTETVRTILTDDSYSLSDYKAIIDGSIEKATGVEMVHASNTLC